MHNTIITIVTGSKTYMVYIVAAVAARPHPHNRRGTDTTDRLPSVRTSRPVDI
jgi:hypothetical protein